MAVLDVDPLDPRRWHDDAVGNGDGGPDGGPGPGVGAGAAARPGGRGVSLAVAFTAAFALGGWKIGLQRLHDNSFFVHLTTGRWILDHGIPRHDMYSFSAPGTRFIAQSWLAELVYGALERSVGVIGIRLLMGVCSAMVMTALFRLALRCCNDRLRAAGLTLLAFAVVAAMWSERPLAFGLVGLAALVWMVEVPSSLMARSTVFALPVVMWLWANTHGSFALGYLYLGLHLGGRALDGARPTAGTRERALLRSGLVSFAVLFVNPYGISLITFPVGLLRRGGVLRDVVEWMSPDFHAQAGMAFAAFLTVAIVVLVGSSHRPSRRDLIVTLPFVLMSFWALRNLAIATIVMLPVVARAAARDRVAHEPDEVDEAPVANRFAGVVLVGLVGLAAIFTLQAVSQPSYDLRGYSVGAMRALVKQGSTSKDIFTTDANAGWLLAAHYPQFHVFMDDRYDMYPVSVINDYSKISAGDPSWAALLTKYHVKTVVWPRTRSLSQLLAQSPQWVRTYRDKSWVVYVRACPGCLA